MINLAPEVIGCLKTLKMMYPSPRFPMNIIYMKALMPFKFYDFMITITTSIILTNLIMLECAMCKKPESGF